MVESTVFGDRRPQMQKYDVEVLRSWQETPTTHAVQVRKPKDFDFKPGQFAVVRVNTGDGEEARPLSIASSPLRDHLEFATKDSGSPFKETLHAMEPGETLSIQGPAGGFVYKEDENEPIIMLSGGIGITPLKSIIEYVVDKDIDREIDLAYSNSTREEIAFMDRLEELEEEHDNIHVDYFITREPHTGVPEEYKTGRIEARMLKKDRIWNEDAIYYICGPPQMVDSMVHMLEEEGIPDEQIRTEQFSGY
ncbi:MAG: FAD-dependent oxidoreductase [Euryarchaeota archaeon]|nr:FAD-dependent oxidoreductase [Euryarchaeota archaeon]